jgi:hypothetical protein
MSPCAQRLGVLRWFRLAVSRSCGCLAPPSRGCASLKEGQSLRRFETEDWAPTSLRTTLRHRPACLRIRRSGGKLQPANCGFACNPKTARFGDPGMMGQQRRGRPGVTTLQRPGGPPARPEARSRLAGAVWRPMPMISVPRGCFEAPRWRDAHAPLGLGPGTMCQAHRAPV